MTPAYCGNRRTERRPPLLYSAGRGQASSSAFSVKGNPSRGLASLRDRPCGPSHHGVRRMKQNNLHRRPGPPACGGRYKGRAELTSSVVPRGTSSPHEAETVIVSRSMIRSCVRGWQSLLRPAELGAIAPHAVHDHCQAARQCGNGLLAPSPLGHVHRPGLQPRPFPCD